MSQEPDATDDTEKGGVELPKIASKAQLLFTAQDNLTFANSSSICSKLLVVFPKLHNGLVYISMR
jgi:hypothetical protein